MMCVYSLDAELYFIETQRLNKRVNDIDHGLQT